MIYIYIYNYIYDNELQNKKYQNNILYYKNKQQIKILKISKNNNICILETVSYTIK